MSQRKYYWEKFNDQHSRGGPELPPGQDLAAMRRGAGREPGLVPHMWPFYTHLNDKPDDSEVWVDAPLLAEHITLTLFGVHQQGRRDLVHQPGFRLGQMLRTLRRSDRFRTDALDARFIRAASTENVHDLAVHMRSLIQLTNTLKQVSPLDYTRLVGDLTRWQNGATIGRVRRQWAADYFKPETKEMKS